MTEYTANGCSDCGEGHGTARLRFRAFAMKVLVVALLVTIASLPVARTVVGSNDARSLGASATRWSGSYQLSMYNVPHLPPESPLGKQEKRQRKRASLKATCLVTLRRGRAHRLFDSASQK